MTHIEQIAAALYQRLSGLAGLYVMRLRAFEESELPATNVLLEEAEPIRRGTIGPQDWRLTVQVVSIVGGDAPFAELTARMKIVHQSLLGEPSLGGLVQTIEATGWRNEPDTELPLVRLWQTFTIDYRNASPDEV